MKNHRLYLIDTEEKIKLLLDDIDITDSVLEYEISRNGRKKEVDIKLKLIVDKIEINKKANLTIDLLN